MTDTEIELRKAIYGLFRVVRMNAYMKLAGKEFEKLLDATDFALAIFEGRPGSEKLESAKSEFEAARAHLRAYCNFREACLKAGQDTTKMCVGLASSMVKVLPRGDAIPAVAATEATVRLARNERESVQVVVAPGDRDLENVRVRFAKDARPGVPSMFTGAPDRCRMGLWFENVKRVRLKNVDVEGQEGEVLLTHGVGEIINEQNEVQRHV